MKNWKPISFEQFREICGKYTYSLINNWYTCQDIESINDGCQCCASYCHKWKKLGRKDLVVSKKPINRYGQDFLNKAAPHPDSICVKSNSKLVICPKSDECNINCEHITPHEHNKRCDIVYTNHPACVLHNEDNE